MNHRIILGDFWMGDKGPRLLIGCASTCLDFETEIDFVAYSLGPVML